MQQTTFTYLWHIIKQLMVVMVLMTICRLLFYFCNTNLYNDLTLKMLVGGMRFDIAVVILANSLFILSGLLPLSYRFSNWYYRLYRLLFIVLNGCLLAFNLIDVAYVAFTKKRSAIDLFTTQGIGTDIVQLAPQFATDYWYLIVIFILFIYVLFKTVRPLKKQKTSWVTQTIILVFAIGFSVLAQRGGLQAKPLLVIHANHYTTSDKTPVVLNTPFSIISSIGKTKLKQLNYLNTDSVSKYVNPIFYVNNSSNKKLDKPNICLIILESFSQEYIGALSGKKSYTPFLDSIIPLSVNFPNSFANGQRSIESLPSLLASLPSLMEQPYITSPYAANEINGLGTYLKHLGYSTSFFHGGQNGTMGFDLFSKQAGFDDYYGKAEYDGSPSDDDGNWGIFDEPFLQFATRKYNTFEEPFASVIFTLSSHHPFIIPDHLKNKFNSGNIPLQNSVEYTDYALKQFFKSAEKQPWFNKTLFIITADHTSIAEEYYYYTYSEVFKVPLFIYAPKLLSPTENKAIVQHLDIMPTILSYLNYDKPIFSFGKVIEKETQQNIVLNRKSGLWQIQNDTLLLRFDGQNTQELFYLPNDSICSINIVENTEKEYYLPLENCLKAYLQTYNSKLINNALKSGE